MAGSRGPGKSSRKGVSQGRVTTPIRHRGTHTGRYVSAEESGRVTQAIDHSHDASPRWFGPTILLLLILGVLMIVLNYLNALPGATSAWYLLAGLITILGAVVMASYYR